MSNDDIVFWCYTVSRSDKSKTAALLVTATLFDNVLRQSCKSQGDKMSRLSPRSNPRIQGEKQFPSLLPVLIQIMLIPTISLLKTFYFLVWLSTHPNFDLCLIRDWTAWPSLSSQIGLLYPVDVGFLPVCLISISELMQICSFVDKIKHWCWFCIGNCRPNTENLLFSTF